MMMYNFTIAQYDDMCDDTIEIMDPRSFWEGMLNDFPDVYDCEWYALIGIPVVEKTINWDFITNKYKERRAIKIRD